MPMTEAIVASAKPVYGSLRQLVAFGLVGGAAFLTHFSVVVSLVPIGVPPLLANVVGFCCAFGVSYAGHSRWTFPTVRSRDRLRVLHRFLRVAVLGFIVNESLFWVLLRHTSLPYAWALIIVLVVVAGGTLLLSRCWAFADD